MVLAALTVATMFTSCAALANALGKALTGTDQTIKVTSSETNFKKAYFYIVEVNDNNGTITESSTNHYDVDYTIGSKVNISDKLKATHAYRIYVNAVHNASNNAVHNYGNISPYTNRPKVTKSSTGAGSVSTLNNSDDIFVIAGDIDYEIVLTVEGEDVVAKLKGTRQASK